MVRTRVGLRGRNLTRPSITRERKKLPRLVWIRLTDIIQNENQVRNVVARISGLKKSAMIFWTYFIEAAYDVGMIT